MYYSTVVHLLCVRVEVMARVRVRVGLIARVWYTRWYIQVQNFASLVSKLLGKNCKNFTFPIESCLQYFIVPV